MRSGSDLFRPIAAVFQFAGVWSPYYGQPSSFGSVSYIIYSVCFISILVLWIVQEIIQLFINIKNVDVEAISGFIPYAAQQSIGLIKIYILISRRHEIRPLIRQMEEAPFHRPNDEFYQKRLNHYIGVSRRFIFSFWFVVYMTMTFQCAVSISHTLNNKRQYKIFCVGNTNETFIDMETDFDCSKPVRVMPWMAYFPFNTDAFPGYQIAFIYEWFLLAFQAKPCFNFDMFVMVWMMGIALQLECLSNDLLCLRENSEKRVLNADNPKDEKAVSREILRQLKKYIIHHNEILDFFEKTNDILTWILFVQYFWMSVLICMILTQLSVSSVFSMQFLHALFYGFVATFQLYIVFYYANETMLQGLEVADAAFYSQWHLSNEYSPKIKPYIVLLIRKAHIKVQLEAGKFFNVDLAGFLSVGKASYSYYALINSK